MHMRVLVCPDKFAGTLSAQDAARAIAEGWQSANPNDEIVVRPLADGGPGFLDVIQAACGGERVPVRIGDPLCRPVDGSVLLVDTVAYIESADACGLHLLKEQERDPTRATSYGLGTLLLSALQHHPKRIIVGLGGSGTNDCGAGMLAALGLVALDSLSREVWRGGTALADCDRIAGSFDFGGVELVAAADVDSPLTGPDGASVVFGPQKGAPAGLVESLDKSLGHFAEVVERYLPRCPPRLAGVPGGGAAGGIAAAILACGGSTQSGYTIVNEATGLDGLLGACDVVVTGEGSFDDQSFRGKTVAGVAGAAMARGVPCVVLAGRFDADPAAASTIGVSKFGSLVSHFGSTQTALAHAYEGLAALAAEFAHEVSA